MGRPAGPTRDTKRLICERALEVFAEKGYAATTMRDVAAAVGLREASLYSHFPGKQAIFDAAVEHQLDRLTQALRSRRALAHPTDDASAYLADGPALTEVVLASYEPLFADAGIVRLRRVLELPRAIFSRLVEAGLFSPCEVDLAARQFHGPVFLALCEGTPWPEARRLVERHLEAFLAQHRAKE